MAGPIKKLILLIITLAFGTLTFGNVLLERRVIPDRKDCPDFDTVEVFLTNDCKPAIFIRETGMYKEGYSLYWQNKSMVLDEYGWLINVFLQNNHIMLASVKDDKIALYEARKEGFHRIGSVELGKELRHRSAGWVFDIPESSDKYYLIGQKAVSAANPLKALAHILSGGHGVTYSKPYLAEIAGGETSRFKEIEYGGKRDESYMVAEVVYDQAAVYCLGLRYSDEKVTLPNGLPGTPVALHFTKYDLKKKKMIQKHTIVEKNRHLSRCNFGSLSMAVNKGTASIVFPWITSPVGTKSSQIDRYTSDIYYSQSDTNTNVTPEQIGKGFFPSVIIDSAGTVYVFWLDPSGNLVCKTKQDDIWSRDRTIVTGIDLLSGFTFKRYIAAEFDSKDNLHLVFPSKGKLIYEKRKLMEN